MANNPFDRTLINVRERPASSDINQLQSNLDRTLRYMLQQQYLIRSGLYPDAPATPITGFIGEGLKARPKSPLALSVIAKAGVGFVYDPTTAASIGGLAGVDDLASWKPIVLLADQEFALTPPPSAPNSRIDILEVAPNRALGGSTSRDVLNPTTGVFDSTTVDKNMGWIQDGAATLRVTPGAPGNPPVESSASVGYTKLAAIRVANGVTTVDADTMLDRRRMLFADGMLRGACRVVIPTVAPAIPVMTALHAPPGVVVSSTCVVPVAGQAGLDVYVFAGSAPTSMYPVVTTSRSAAGSSNLATSQVGPIVVDAVLQAALAGANASPPVKVAIGQPGWQFNTLITNIIGAPPVLYIDISWTQLG